MRVAAIMPAFNEANRIEPVLKTLYQVKGLDEIIVVDDGSTDGTLDKLPRNNGILPVRLEVNQGKAGALLAGVKLTSADVVVFLDADLVGIKPHHIESLIEPIINGNADMSIAVFCGGRWRTDWAQRLVPNVTGQRALRRDFFLSIPRLEQARYGIEIALTLHAKKRALRINKVPWEGVTHIMKEEKLGFVRGTVERAKMYWQIGTYVTLTFRKNGTSNK